LATALKQIATGQAYFSLTSLDHPNAISQADWQNDLLENFDVNRSHLNAKKQHSQLPTN
jgi:hypothetical protein